MVVFTTTNCSPCNQVKAITIPDLRRRGIRVREISDPHTAAQYGVTRFPVVMVARNQRQLSRWTGFVSAETVCQVISNSWVSQRASQKSTTTIYDGKQGSSHESRESLIDHLLNEGVHRGRHTESKLKSLSDDQLNELHNADHPPVGQQTVSLPAKSMPARYIQWPGWGTIDLATYNRNCNCGMCQSIRAKQQEYQRQMQQYQSLIPADQQPCPIETIETMLDLMRLRSDDVLADLGCGDGRILIAAARRGIRGIGVELDHARAEVAREAVRTAGVSHMVHIATGDARQFDTSQATAITAYLYPTLLEELAPKMKQVRVVASPFHEVPGLSMVRHGDVWIYRKG